jgi:hypothetical protein
VNQIGVGRVKWRAFANIALKKVLNAHLRDILVHLAPPLKSAQCAITDSLDNEPRLHLRVLQSLHKS